MKIAKKRVRPVADGVTVSVRLHGVMLDALDAWIAQQPKPRPKRPEAIRQLLAKGLAETPMMLRFQSKV